MCGGWVGVGVGETRLGMGVNSESEGRESVVEEKGCV
jgi:hypothetical protein